MTISTPASPLSYAGNDSTKIFAISWAYVAKSHVVATLRASDGTETTQVLNTNYTLTKAGQSGTLTMTIAPATGETLLITSEPPNTQETDLPLGGPLPARSIEDALDAAAQVSQKIQVLFDRSLRVPKTDTQSGDDLEMPNETTRASKFLAFDANGDPIASTGGIDPALPISSFMETVIDDTTAAAARTTLDAVGISNDETVSGDKDWTGVQEYISAAPIILQGANDHATNKITVNVADPTEARSINIPDQDVDLGALPSVNELRLSLESGVPVSTSDQTAKTTIYLTPYKGNRLALYDGSVGWKTFAVAEKSVAVPSTTVTPADIFAYDNVGTVTLEATDWTNDTTRATALVYQDGILVKSGATTRRYLGTIRTTSVSGQCEDSLANRFLYNYYNRVWREGQGTFSADRAASTTSFAEFNTEIRCNWIVGVVEDVIRASCNGTFSSSSAAGMIAIAVDSATVNVPNLTTATFAAVANANQPIGLSGALTGLAIGFHYITMLGHNGVSGTTDMYGTETQLAAKAYLQLEAKM